MKVLNKELGVDTSTYDFRGDLVMKLEKCIEIPFATENSLFGQQEYLKYMI